MAPHTTARDALDVMAATLARLRGAEGCSADRSVTELIDCVRQQREALHGLPSRYLQVLDLLLDRFEASALFTEESCSFSQRDLVDALGQWLDKARAAADGST